jgi:hypothetical protein
MNRTTHNSLRHRGQAMTELLIAASFILVPLFLLVPTLGKFIDMRHAAIQAARYQGWEYTVWYAEDCEREVFAADAFDPEECPSGGFEAHDALPFKTREKTRRESIARYLGSPDGEALAVISGDASAETPVPTNLLWSDHAANRMVKDVVDGAGPVSSQSPKGIPVLDTVFDVVLGAIKLIFGAYADVLGFLGSDAGFDAINTDGLATGSIGVTMDSVAAKRLMTGRDAPAMPDLTFTGQAAVLTDGWNAGGREHTYYQASGMVITTGLRAVQNQPVLSQAWNFITAIIAPELRKCNVPNYLQYGIAAAPTSPGKEGSLWFGHIDTEAVHRDRLDDGTQTHICDPRTGACDFNDTYTRQKECIEEED